MSRRPWTVWGPHRRWAYAREERAYTQALSEARRYGVPILYEHVTEGVRAVVHPDGRLVQVRGGVAGRLYLRREYWGHLIAPGRILRYPPSPHLALPGKDYLLMEPWLPVGDGLAFYHDGTTWRVPCEGEPDHQTWYRPHEAPPCGARYLARLVRVRPSPMGGWVYLYLVLPRDGAVYEPPPAQGEAPTEGEAWVG